ncbi:MAG: GTPase HflX [Eubacteriales bacterium]
MNDISEEKAEKVLLAGLLLPRDDSEQAGYMMEELERLADTAGAVVVRSLVQKRDRPDPATFFGHGKAAVLAEICREEEADLVVVDREITPAQARNLEDITGVRVIDRTQLILDIFARRARTKEGKLQVELAQLEYMLPRLTGRGVELSRLGGGIGTRGPGETKLEVDRRRIKRRIYNLKEELEEVKRHRGILRRGRKGVPLPLIALVGYTNAGKSALLKIMTGADVLIEDKLFATLDPTTRQVKLPNNEAVLITDTVGFIKNLPHHLVAAFRATLEEVVEADLLLHVVDSAHPNLEAQMEAVDRVLVSLGAAEKPVVVVFNKVDLNVGPGLAEIGCLPACRGRTGSQAPAVAVSAISGQGVGELLNLIAEQLSGGRVRQIYFVPRAKSAVLSLIHEKGKVFGEVHGQDGVNIDVELGRVWAHRIEARLKEC